MAAEDAANGKERKSLRLLAFAALLFALTVAGTALWIHFSGDDIPGEPVVRLTISPEEEAAKEPITQEQDLPPADELVTITDVPLADPYDLSPDEKALLDAARNLKPTPEGAEEKDIAGEVRIIGAETASASGSNAKTAVTPLAAAPDPALVERNALGPLPKIASDGRAPWRVYAHPLAANTQAERRIALVVSGMGISASATAHAIRTLPPEVTLSFAPYGANLQNWIDQARAAGHEVLLELPMEPFGYPQNDPGPHTLLTSASSIENISRLEWLMSRFTGYVGVMNYQGARFTASSTALKPIMTELAGRGLLYVDNGASTRSLALRMAGETKTPATLATRIIDPVQTPAVIATSLDALKKTALENGVAVGVASGFPVTVDALTEWAKTLQRENYALVPVSATVQAPTPSASQ